MHLTQEEVLDLAEGTRPEAAVPHLTACDDCRQEVAALRAILSVAADADVPEPSPLFWDHLSARVHADVAAEGAAVEGRRSIRVAEWFSWKIALPAAACLVAVLGLAVTLRQQSAAVPAGAPAPEITSADTADSTAALADDPSWTFVTGLAAELDWDAVIEAGIAPSGGVDRAVFDLNLDERRELQRLIQEEIERSKVTTDLKS